MGAAAQAVTSLLNNIIPRRQLNGTGGRALIIKTSHIGYEINYVKRSQNISSTLLRA